MHLHQISLGLAPYPLTQQLEARWKCITCPHPVRTHRFAKCGMKVAFPTAAKLALGGRENVQKNIKKQLTGLCPSGKVALHTVTHILHKMRTKALLCCAALAAGIATSAVAQSNVYSLNIVGYVNTPITAGFNLIANPLDNGTNDLNSLFAGAGFGDTIYLFNNGAFTSSTFLGTWSPDPTLLPGSGIFYQAGAAFTNTFVGNVMTGNLSNPIPAGFSLKASRAPVSDTLDGLGLPGSFGDTVYAFRNGAYQSSTYLGTWSALTPPNVAVGEAFWVQASAAGNWTRSFSP